MLVETMAKRRKALNKRPPPLHGSSETSDALGLEPGAPFGYPVMAATDAALQLPWYTPRVHN